MNLPLKTDLSGKVAVVTGAGGVLCSVFAKALAAAGAKVALLNRTFANAEVVAGRNLCRRRHGESVSVQRAV